MVVLELGTFSGLHHQNCFAAKVSFLLCLKKKKKKMKRFRVEQDLHPIQPSRTYILHP